MKHHVNICDVPYSADPTGQVDCTDVILRALDDLGGITALAFRQGLAEVEALPAEGCSYHPSGFENHRSDGEVFCVCCVRLPFVPVLYFPPGTYLVSDTLRYRRTDLINTYGSDMNQQIRIRGAGVGETTIRLQDATPGFEAGTQKPILSYMPGVQSNVSMSNYCEDLTIDCGSGNAGAVGVDFFANNSGAVRNVNVRSGDGSGFAGVQLGHSNYSGVLLKHIAVEGFDHGLHVDSGTGGMFAHAEDITVREQRISGVTVGAISLSIRNLRTESVPVALTCVEPIGHTVLVDSRLAGTGPVAIDRHAGSLYVSNVKVEGFAATHDLAASASSRTADDPEIHRRASAATEDQDVAASASSWTTGDALAATNAGRIAEWVHPHHVGPATGDSMPRLPIKETPIYAHRGESCGVRAFGALGNGINDDTPAIQRAFDSGAAEICFEPGRYLLNASVHIPAHVEHVDFGFCDLVAGIDLKQSDAEGFRITGNDDAAPLFIERILAWEQWSGAHCSFTHAGTRTVCFRDLHTQTLKFYRNTVPGGRVFFDNVATTTGVIPGTTGHGRCAVSLTGQKVWARQLNPERGEPMILNDGGDLVLMGYKSEGTGIVVETINGGRTEVLGGVINVGREADTAFVAVDAQQRISTASHAWRSVAYYRTPITQSTDGKTVTVQAGELPLRGFDPERGPQYVIPLYTG